jgi:NAD(P)H-hydrate repair Nnr-like enzyme with NAD(P)H-hydrate dehydratase domain
MRAVVYAAHRVKVLKQEGAKVALIAAGALCIAGSGGVLLGICLATAAASFAIFYRLAEAEFQDRILSAKNDECAVDRRTGKSCQWER